MKIKAAISRRVNELTIEEIELDPPKAGEVLVQIRAAGVCHSDLHTYRGELRATPPLVLGHEGAGIVRKVGPGVTSVEPGNHVLINWLPACRTCSACLDGRPNVCERLFRTTFQGWMPDGSSRLKSGDGVQLKHYLGSAAMAEYAVLPEEGVIPVPDDVPFAVAAIVGCAVATGIGSVINTAQAKPGKAAAVIGCGGVGLSVIVGCQLAGCHPIVAVDVLEEKLEFARRMGATGTLNARNGDVVKNLRALPGNGPEYVFDSVGSAATIQQALRSTRPGGTAVIIGLHGAKLDVPISPAVLVQHNKRLLGSFVGSIRPAADLPMIVELYRGGRLNLDDLVTKTYRLEDLPQAFEDMETGKVARGVILFD